MYDHGRMTTRWQLALGGIVVAWSLAAAIGSLRAVQVRPHDPMAEQEAEFGALAPYLPPRGEISYLEPDADDQVPDHPRPHYTAQYALSPRVVVARIGAELVIVPRGTVNPGGDERLKGYELVTTLPNGHALYRRVAP
jgi:hypothetical protein